MLSEADLDRLRAAGKVLRQGIVAPLTVLGYSYDWSMWTRWCRDAGRIPLPATPETVSLYLTDLLGQGKKITTARRRKCAIVYEHRVRGYPSPATAEVLELLAGAQRIRAEKPRQMRPLTVRQLRAMSIDLARTGTDAAIRNRAILVCGFASALRRSNLAALNLEDVEFAPQGLILTINREKQDQEGKGRFIGLKRGLHRNTDPVRTLRDWLKRRGRNTPGPLFWRLDPKHKGQRMDGECIYRVVKKCVARLGIDPADFGSHSMRAALVTEAGNRGISPWLIAAQTGHKNMQVLERYYRRGQIWRANVSGMLGL